MSLKLKLKLHWNVIKNNWLDGLNRQNRMNRLNGPNKLNVLNRLKRLNILNILKRLQFLMIFKSASIGWISILFSILIVTKLTLAQFFLWHYLGHFLWRVKGSMSSLSSFATSGNLKVSKNIKLCMITRPVGQVNSLYITAWELTPKLFFKPELQV